MQRFRLIAALLVLAFAAGCAPSVTQQKPTSSDPKQAAWEAFQILTADVANTGDAADQQALVDAFLRDYPSSPLVSDTTAIFLVNQPNATRVLLTGDMTNWFDVLQMQRLGQTSLWSYQQELPI